MYTMKKILLIAVAALSVLAGCKQQTPAEALAAFKTDMETWIDEYTESAKAVDADATLSDEQKREKFSALQETVIGKITDAGRVLLDKYPSDTLVAPAVLGELYGYLEDDELASILDKLSEPVKADKFVARLVESSAAKQATAVGKKFTDFTVDHVAGVDKDGNPIYEKKSLSDFVGKGKVMLVDFWSPWCPPCKAEIPNIKAIWEKYAGEDFMRQYGPRIFHFIGSSGYNPNKGTEVLGTASGGVKITLYKINNLKGYVPGSTVYGGEDMDELNQNYFHTMHHEFSHIQHQTKPYPITFGQITSSTYDPVDWGDRDSLASHTMGYVTQYGSSANYEDFVETLSCIITDSDLRWMRRIIRATIPGFRAGDKEDIQELVTNLGIDANKAGAEWTKFSIYDEKKYDVELGTYQPTNRVGIQQDVDDHSPVPWSNYINKVYDPNKGKYVDEYQYTLKKTFNSFAEFLDWVPIKTDDSITGINSLLKKISIATAWHKEKWGLNTFTLRKEVAARRKNINSYLSSEVTIYDYK